MTATLTGIRPSLWARCVTAAVFQGRGEAEAEHPPEAQEYFFRGHVFEEIVMRQIVAKHGADNVERQVVIPIPGIGEGHADGYLKTEKALIEIKSTTAAFPNSDTFTNGVNQLRIYIAFHPEAVQGYLYMLDPNRMKPADVYTIVLPDDERENIREERRHIVAAVANGTDVSLAHRGKEWRPCTKPSQARGRMCPFAASCFEGWEPPAPNEIPDPAALSAASELAAIKGEIRTHEQAVKALEEGKKATEAVLLELTEPGDNLIGPFMVKRSDVKRSPSFSMKAAEAAGFPVQTLDEFLRPGAEYSTFRVAKAEDVGDVDFGEAPF